jgi:hypothetical protein
MQTSSRKFNNAPSHNERDEITVAICKNTFQTTTCHATRQLWGTIDMLNLVRWEYDNIRMPLFSP